MDKALKTIAFTLENRTGNAHTIGVRLSLPVTTKYERRQDGKTVALVQTGTWGLSVAGGAGDQRGNIKDRADARRSVRGIKLDERPNRREPRLPPHRPWLLRTAALRASHRSDTASNSRPYCVVNDPAGVGMHFTRESFRNA